MKCPYCNSDLPEGSKFCGNCGANLQNETEKKLEKAEAPYREPELTTQTAPTGSSPDYFTVQDQTKPQKKRGGCLKVVLIAFGAIVLLSVLGGLLGGNKGDDSKTATKENESQPEVEKEESEKKKSKDGFDADKNSSFEFEGFRYSIPDYFGDVADNSDETNKYFYAERGDAVAMLFISSADAGEDAKDVDWGAFQDGVMSSTEDPDVVFSKEVTVAECPGTNFSYTGVISDMPIEANVYAFYDGQSKKIINTTLLQSEGTEYDYRDDFERIVESITFVAPEQEDNQEKESSDSADASKESAEPDVPIEYINALSRAESYSDMLHMSKQGLYDQLTSEYGDKFSAEAAQYAVDNLDVDYKENALRKGEEYANAMSMSKRGVYDQLVSEYGEKFTAEEAQYAIDNIQADWKANALEKAKDYQEMMDMSPEAIRDQLTSDYGEKFTAEEAAYAIDNLSK